MEIQKKKPLDEIVNEIIKMNNWWSENYNTDSLVVLSNLRSKLSGYLFSFAPYIGETKTYALEAERDRKVKKANIRKELMADHSIAKADDEAIIQTEKEQKKADDLDGYYSTLRLMLDQANKVDDAIAQKISILKQEKYKSEI